MEAVLTSRVQWREGVSGRTADTARESAGERGTRLERAAGSLEPRFLTWRRVVEWALLPLAFVLLRFVPDRLIAPADWLLLLAAAVLFASPVVFSSYREFVKGRAAQSAELLAVEYRARLGLTLAEALTPIAELLGRIALREGEKRVGLKGQLRQRVVDAAAALTSAERARSTFFVLEGRTLRAVAWSGRPEPPAQTLVKTAPGGELAYRLVEDHGRLLVLDAGASGAPALDLDGTFGTYLAAAVYASSTNFGLLTVDAPGPGTLEESDLDVVAALAQTLGAGLAL